MSNAPRRVSPPADSVLAADYGAAHLADAFAIALPDGAPGDADALDKPLGLKTTAAMREHLARSGVAHVDIFRLLSARPQEAVFGETGRHLDFKLSNVLSGRQVHAAQ